MQMDGLSMGASGTNEAENARRGPRLHMGTPRRTDAAAFEYVRRVSVQLILVVQVRTSPNQPNHTPKRDYVHKIAQQIHTAIPVGDAVCRDFVGGNFAGPDVYLRLAGFHLRLSRCVPQQRALNSLY